MSQDVLFCYVVLISAVAGWQLHKAVLALTFWLVMRRLDIRGKARLKEIIEEVRALGKIAWARRKP